MRAGRQAIMVGVAFVSLTWLGFGISSSAGRAPTPGDEDDKSPQKKNVLIIGASSLICAAGAAPSVGGHAREQENADERGREVFRHRKRREDVEFEEGVGLRDYGRLAIQARGHRRTRVPGRGDRIREASPCPQPRLQDHPLPVVDSTWPGRDERRRHESLSPLC